MVLDGNGYPHITWEVDTIVNSEIYYVHWNGTNWECANGDDYSTNQASANVSNNAGPSWRPSLALDDNGYPHIAWNDYTPGNAEVLYVHWNGTNWQCANGDDYSVNPGSANVSGVNSGSGYLSLAVDSSGYPHIAWRSNVSGRLEILYVHWNGTNWQCANGDDYSVNPASANVSNNIGYSEHPSIILDDNGYPHIAWIQNTSGNYETYYVHWNGSNWECANGNNYSVNPASANVSGVNSGSGYLSLAVDSSGYPHIAWRSNVSGRLEILYVHWNGTNWQCANGDDYSVNPASANVSINSVYSENPSLTLDDNGYPHIVWDDTSLGNYEILFVHWNGGSWECGNGHDYSVNPASANVSNSSGSSYNPSLELDGNGYAHIVWRDFTPGSSEIYYLHWNSFESTFSLLKSVDVNNDGVYSDDHTVIQNGDVLTYQINLDKQSGFDPVFDGYVYDMIPSGTVYISGSAMPLSQLSYSDDFGTSWTPGEPPGTAPASTLLRWDVIDIPPLTSGNLINAFFSVTVVDSTIMGINNTSYFNHRDSELTGFLASNIISNTTVECSGCPDCPECPECPDDPDDPPTNSANLEVTKTAGSMHYYKNDLFTFKAKVGNVGDLEATNVMLTDNFPREMEIVGSRPEGVISNGKWTYNVGRLNPGEGRLFDFIFRLKGGVNLGSEPLSLTNIITATSDETDKATDNASIVISSKTGSSPLSLDVKWDGIDVKTSTGKAGELITLALTPDGGSSPYEIVVDWGDGEKTFASEVTNSKEVFHKYTSSGKYKVIIKLTDNYGKTKYVERVLYID